YFASTCQSRAQALAKPRRQMMAVTAATDAMRGIVSSLMFNHREHSISSFAEARAVIGHPALPALARQHRFVDHHPRLAAMLHLQHRLGIRGAIAGEALIGPAQGMGRQDHVVES